MSRHISLFHPLWDLVAVACTAGSVVAGSAVERTAVLAVVQCILVAAGSLAAASVAAALRSDDNLLDSATATARVRLDQS
jgi:hypothetical protein